jgi:peroxiredoxin/outer membrane lipoprotein-sorting protein
LAASLAALLSAFGSQLSVVHAEGVGVLVKDFTDEPAAHSLFERMMDGFRRADSLSYVSHYTLDTEKSGRLIDYTYRVWLKKPNYFRVELESYASGKTLAVLVGDGQTAWMYWPPGRPEWEFIIEAPADYQSTRNSSYRKTPAPAAGYSIGHALLYGAHEMSLPIIDPSTFHGLADSLLTHLDGVKSLGTAVLGNEACDKIEVSIMEHQRSWYVWLAQRDTLPRKLEQVVRLGNEIVTKEDWSSVTINAEIPLTLFKWQPPDGWSEWQRPALEDLLLKPGTTAPDFELASADGNRVKLSDFRGRVVWLYFWRVGCPACREGIGPVHDLYLKYKDKGLVILGFNSADETELALNFIHKANITFPTVLDSSDKATNVQFKTYGCYGVPANYVIHRDGTIVDAWYEDNETHDRALAALKKTGGELGSAIP